MAYIKSEPNKKHSVKLTYYNLQFWIGGSAAKVCILKLTHLSCKIKWFKLLDRRGEYPTPLSRGPWYVSR